MEPLAKGLKFSPYGGVQIESSYHSGYCWQVGSHSLMFNYKNCFPSWITVSFLRYSPRIWNISFLCDLRLSQQCCWIFKSSGTWHYVVGWLVPIFHTTELPAPSVSCSLGLLINHNIDTNIGSYSLRNMVTHPTRPHFSLLMPVFAFVCIAIIVTAFLLYLLLISVCLLIHISIIIGRVKQ